MLEDVPPANRMMGSMSLMGSMRPMGNEPNEPYEPYETYRPKNTKYTKAVCYRLKKRSALDHSMREAVWIALETVGGWLDARDL